MDLDFSQEAAQRDESAGMEGIAEAARKPVRRNTLIDAMGSGACGVSVVCEEEVFALRKSAQKSSIGCSRGSHGLMGTSAKQKQSGVTIAARVVQQRCKSPSRPIAKKRGNR